jgi:putative transposase
MKEDQLTIEQIIKIQNKVDAGAKVDQLCRRHGVSRPTYHQWRRRYGGLEVNEAKRLRGLQEDNRRLKRLV